MILREFFKVANCSPPNQWFNALIIEKYDGCDKIHCKVDRAGVVRVFILLESKAPTLKFVGAWRSIYLIGLVMDAKNARSSSLRKGESFS